MTTDRAKRFVDDFDEDFKVEDDKAPEPKAEPAINTEEA